MTAAINRRLGEIRLIASGTQFGQWTVTADLGMQNRRHMIAVKCNCGATRQMRAEAMREGRSLSCGCGRKPPIQFKHGHACHGFISKTFNCWSRMLGRCNDKNRKNYGARGITVCERWQVFENFLADMGEVPPGLTIERIDSNGNYEPSNCRWASWTEQARNRRGNKIITFNGEAKSMAQWCDDLNMSYVAICQRFRQGWTPERAFTTSIVKKGASHASHV